MSAASSGSIGVADVASGTEPPQISVETPQLPMADLPETPVTLPGVAAVASALLDGATVTLQDVTQTVTNVVPAVPPVVSPRITGKRPGPSG